MGTAGNHDGLVSCCVCGGYCPAVTSGPDGLFHGERVLWVGSPARFPVLDRVGKVLLGVGVVYGVAVVLLVIAIVRAGNLPMLLLGGLFVVCVLSVILVVFLQRRSGLRSTRYLVTDRRVIVTSKWFGQAKVRTAALGDLGLPVVVAAEGATVGTIRLGSTSGLTGAVVVRISPIVFREVEDARRVRAIILAAQGDTN